MEEKSFINHIWPIKDNNTPVIPTHSNPNMYLADDSFMAPLFALILLVLHFKILHKKSMKC